MMTTNIGKGQSNITRAARVLLLIARNLAKMLLVKFQQPLALVLLSSKKLTRNIVLLFWTMLNFYMILGTAIEENMQTLFLKQKNFIRHRIRHELVWAVIWLYKAAKDDKHLEGAELHWTKLSKNQICQRNILG